MDINKNWNKNKEFKLKIIYKSFFVLKLHLYQKFKIPVIRNNIFLNIKSVLTF